MSKRIECADLEKIRVPHMQSCTTCKASFVDAFKAFQTMLITGEYQEPPGPCPEMQSFLNEHRSSCKKCQENRAILEQMKTNGSISLSHQEILQARKKAGAKKRCSFPDTAQCQGKIINAHSVQLKILEKIARDGHVYYFKGTYDNLLRNDWVFKAMPVGIHQASTFTGFCEYHDNYLFAPIEQVEFSVDKLKSFLLSYRAICFELFNQEIWLDLFPMYRELPRGLPLPFQLLCQTEIRRDEMERKWALRGLRSVKSDYDKALQHQDFSEMNYYAVEIDTIPPFLWSGVSSPEWDFAGRIIQRFSESKIPAALTFSAVTFGPHCWLVFGWLGKSQEIMQFIKSFHMLSDDELIEAVRRFVFEFVENVYFNPAWWENNQEVQQFLEDRIMSKFKQRFRGSREQLLSDGYRFLAASVVSRKTTMNL